MNHKSCGLSIAVITKDEEVNLDRTLESVAWADEVVIVDSGSTDGTLSIAARFGATVFRQKWMGFVAQKNFAIANCSMQWVLSLDADEALDLELQDQIKKALLTNPEWDAAYIKRKNYFLGRWIKYGGFYPDKKLRLFRNGSCIFRGGSVHERLECTGTMTELAGNIEHYAYPTLHLYIEHMNRYSTLGADDLETRRKTSGLLNDVIVRPLLTFLYNYLFRGGFLDGREGLILNLYHAFYVSMKYAKRLMTQREDGVGQQTKGHNNNV